MSWRTGAGLILKIWPIVKEEIQDQNHRKDFGKDLLALFISHDIDPYDIEEVDPELDKLIVEYYEES